KPRSSDTETRDGVTLPSYRGDIVNRPAFTESDRQPDPELLLRGYERSALTLNFIRSLTDGGFADLHHPEYWDLDFMAHSPKAAEYRRMVESISDGIRFLEAVSGTSISEMNRVDFFTSHEGLHLYYEQAQTRQVPRRTGWYNLSTHFPWIGERTRDVGGAHVEYFRGIRNPIGVKIGPSVKPDELVRLIEALDPNDEPGRLTLIHRFGAEKIADCLPPLLAAVEQTKKHVVWCCDPMHGNNEVVDGYKTRSFEKILEEIEQAFDLHARHGTCLGGVHFELTGDNVTECVGGARGLKPHDLSRAYKSLVDPRLNCEQALEMAMLLAGRMRR
ncbi:MAG TPA: 3-deoxy-7-phosphoheptulonate synthase class II, partial [Planctomycetota bacterium]|nr:3-deoxy-7-phosphoheptulonate synthase class II [Planctomycetota bacterium]